MSKIIIKKNFVSGSITDRGAIKKINQDKIYLSSTKTESGEAIFAVVCGGVGGLARGDVAANTVAWEFSQWFKYHIGEAIEDPGRIEKDWRELTEELDERIWGYGRQKGIKLGTTMSVLLILPDKTYYTIDVGDNRIYRIVENKFQQENKKQPKGKGKDSQSVMGGSDMVEPNFANGSINSEESFLLCTKGFYHMLFSKKLDKKLLKDGLEKDAQIRKKLEEVIKELTNHGEKDNISAVLIKVC